MSLLRTRPSDRTLSRFARNKVRQELKSIMRYARYLRTSLRNASSPQRLAQLIKQTEEFLDQLQVEKILLNNDPKLYLDLSINLLSEAHFRLRLSQSEQPS